jgi:predicted metalloprotease
VIFLRRTQRWLDVESLLAPEHTTLSLAFHTTEGGIMQWEGREESQNVEDQRGIGVKGGVALGGGGLIIALIALFLGVDPQKVAQLVQPDNGPAQQQQVADPEEDHLAHFAKVIFHDTEVIWSELFTRYGKTYRKPILRLFTGQVNSACGSASTAVGPFYCPGDEHVYIDLAFYRQLEEDLKSPGEFAKAYVLAHEVGHHVQKLLGYSARVDEVRQRGNDLESHHASVRLELQADFLAGVWAFHAQKKYNFLERGDVDSALNAARQIGDDKLQKKARGYVVPDSFTHGTSEQRSRWFKRGLEKGDLTEAKLLFDTRYEEL